ncbi:MAG: 16S rRNA processing protein RimM [Chloroflexi bacterium]|jgi:16S rRNA processing protein RimM|nr:16S rRNA processing protein RimM [Chloroflexota bacterium]MBT4942398.1 16S rRNA processing protein RimM [Chloroflexota bacterium]MBT5476465.1 16S rRNA processing protein RimM [Chloroflexota bacterium]MBT5893383.1 16S rRNA processing protein RimM [Chloroflexota bacterium]MBT6707599.1 16S rRNA processing protein RimM [Chloroflexota bacterium]
MTDSNSQPDTPGEELNELVVVGRVRRPTGIKGALLVEVYSGITDRFIVGDIVIADGREYEIVETGKSGDSAKLRFENINSIEKADHLRDLELSVPAEELPENPPGVYYHYEILGSDVTTVDGQHLGKLTEILETGSNDVFIITAKPAPGKKKGDEILIPVLEGVIVDVDKKVGTMKIDPPDGIL